MSEPVTQLIKQKLRDSVNKHMTLGATVSADELEREALRKAIHMLIAVVPVLTGMVGATVTLALLAAGTLFYTYTEIVRSTGHEVLFISRVTSFASRERDRGGITHGPITLAIGAMLALLLYPEPIAAIAIYALAFGDGFASLTGKLFGIHELPGTGGKTVEGSSACLVAVTVSTFAVSGMLRESLLVGIVAMFVEMLPTHDFDNLVLPVGVGLVATALFSGLV